MAEIRRAGRFWKPGYGPGEATAAMTEKVFQAAVIEMAAWLGWRTYHPRYSIASARGWPDLVLCKPPRLLCVELKTDGRKPTTYQLEWLDALRQCGVETSVWWTADWHSGEVERVLKGGGTDHARTPSEADAL